MESIGTKALGAALAIAEEKLIENLHAIDKAYLESDEGLTIRMPIKFYPHKDGVKVDVSIAFYTGQIKDGDWRVVNERQESLPGMDK